MSQVLTRRAALVGALASSAALAVPTAGVLAGIGGLRDADAAKPVFVRVGSPALPMDPESRIARAITEIQMAIAEQHPDWKLQIEDRSIGVLDGRSKIESAPRRRAILLYASDERYGPERARFHVDYLSTDEGVTA